MTSNVNRIYSNMEYETQAAYQMFDSRGGNDTANNTSFYNISQEQFLDNFNAMKFKSKLPAAVDHLLSVFMIIVAVLSVTLNTLVLTTMCYRKKKLTTLEVYIVNLCILELLHALYAHPQVIISGFNHEWPFGDVACDMYATAVFFFGTCSISTLATMSLMRYIKVCRMNLDKHISMGVTISTLVPVYLNALIWAVGPLLGWGHYGVEQFGLSCSIDWSRPSYSYIMCIFLFVFLLPLTLMVVCYSRICIMVRNTQKVSSMVSSKNDVCIAKMCAAICGGFMFAWTPYAVVAFIKSFSPNTDLPLFLTVAAPYFAKSSTFYNPLVYFFVIKRFRDDAKQMLKCLPIKTEICLLKCMLNTEADNDQDNDENIELKCIGSNIETNKFGNPIK